MSPLATLAEWIGEAERAGLPEPEAMALATVGVGGVPSLRFVLCRGVDERGLRFFTNFESRKGRELADNPHAAAVFHWASMARQVRVEGRVERLPAEDSDAYFRSRPRGSQIASAVSPQSRPIESLEDLQARCADLEARLAGAEVPRPAHWGGFLLHATAVELWRGGPDRLHDRLRYVRRGEAWDATRLAP
jgi:pyridoxamine 5'-phosphate oxidase